MEQQNTFKKLTDYARKLKKNLYALYLAYQDNRVSWYAKLVAIFVVAYAFSPIDLIPDFIPVLGYLDDLILVPLGISLALKLIPPYIIEEKKEQAEEELRENGKPKNWLVAVLFILIWIFVTLWVGKYLYGILH